MAQKPAAAPAMLELEQAAGSWYMSSFRHADNAAILSNRYHRLVFYSNSRRFEYNGVSVWLSYPALCAQRQWRIAAADARKTVWPLLSPLDALQDAGTVVVVLDAGHGGGDTGAMGRFRNAREKDITLELAKKVRDLLPPHMRVRLTRAWDRDICLAERCERANRWGADVFVSIHLNSAAASSAAGIETHVLPPAGAPVTSSPSTLYPRDGEKYLGNAHDEANMVLGYYLQRGMLKHTSASDRGVRRSRFVVVRDTACPAVLVECGFLSNPTEEAKLRSEDYQNRLARGIAEGVICFISSAKRAKVLK